MPSEQKNIDRYLGWLNVQINMKEGLFLSSEKSSTRRQAYHELKTLQMARDKYLEERDR